MNKDEGRKEWKHVYIFPFVHEMTPPVLKKKHFPVYTLFVVIYLFHIRGNESERVDNIFFVEKWFA